MSTQAGNDDIPTIHAVPRAVTVPASFFGLHWSKPLATDAPRTPWRDFGHRSLRLWDTMTNWRHIEPVRGTYDWSRTDAYAELGAANGVDILYCLGQAPDWATGGASKGPSANYNILPPANVDDFARFVGRVHERYPDWRLQLWNEPPGFFDGTPRQLADLLRAGRRAAPGAYWVGPGFTRGTSPLAFMDRFLGAIDPDDLDAVGFHPYAFPEPPERMLALATSVRSLMAAHDGFAEKPLWATEWTWSTYRDNGVLVPADGAVMPHALASAYIARGMILSAVAGLDRTFFYGPDHPWSQLRLIDLADRQTVLPAGSSARHMAGLLAGAELGDLQDQATPNLYRVTYRKGEARGFIWWTADDTTADVPMDGISRLVDSRGEPLGFGATYRVTHSPVIGFG